MALTRTSSTRWILALAAVSAALGADDGTKSAPEAIAVINGQTITREQLQERIAQSRAMDPGRFDRMSEEQKEVALKRTILAMILRELKLQEVRKKQISIEDSQVADLYRLECERRGGEAAFAAELRRNGNTPAKWQEQTREMLAIHRLERGIGGSAAREDWLQGLLRNARVTYWDPTGGNKQGRAGHETTGDR